METIGENLKKLRKEKRWSIRKLSSISGVAQGYISELESNKYANPSLKVICMLCTTLEVTPNELIPSKLYREG